jgi:3-dehydroquinate synthase
MVVMLLPDRISIKSSRGDYSVHFENTVALSLQAAADAGSYLLIDSRVCRLHDVLFRDLLSDRIITIDSNEEQKEYSNVGRVIQTLVERGINRNTVLVAVGGGVVQDIVSFAASVLLRGISWEFFPTTLLACSDSCIGGKTSINLGMFKNQLGTFHPPRSIHIDPVFLTTLNREEIQSGLGEILHYYVYENSRYLEDFEQKYETFFSDPAFILVHIAESLRIKRNVIEQDEFDRGERRKFNYGHTFGHALEAVTDFQVKHGQAVTMGMEIANHLSLNRGLLDSGEFNRLSAILRQNFPEVRGLVVSMAAYLRALKKDKKNTDVDLTCILNAGKASLQVSKVSMDKHFGAELATVMKACGLDVTN